MKNTRKIGTVLAEMDGARAEGRTDDMMALIAEAKAIYDAMPPRKSINLTPFMVRADPLEKVGK